MSLTDYLLDSALVLLVLLQVRERALTTRSLVRPLVIVAIAVAGGQAWTDALLAMAVFEVLGRSVLLYVRRGRARSTVALARA